MRVGDVTLHAARHDVAGGAPDRGVRVEGRIEDLAHFIELQKRFPEERQLARNVEPAFARGSVHAEEHRTDVHLLQSRVLHPDDELRDAAPEQRRVEALVALAHGDQHVGDVVAFAVARRQKHFQQVLAHPRRRLPDHAEVEQRDVAVVGEEDIARMRVGVEQAVDQHLLQIGAKQLLGERGAFDLESRKRADRRDLAAFHVIHRQHAPGAVIRHGLRHVDQCELLQVRPDGDEIARFALVIKLVFQRNAKLLEHVEQPVAPAELRVRVDEVGDLCQHFEVVRDLPRDVGPLDLDDDATPVTQRGAVHLPERRRGDRIPLETRKRLRDAHAELGRDDLLDGRVIERLDVVLQAGQRLKVGFG